MWWIKNVSVTTHRINDWTQWMKSWVKSDRILDKIIIYKESVNPPDKELSPSRKNVFL